IDTNIDFLFGPLTYLYVTALTARSGFRFSLQQWRHFLPFLIGFLLLIPLMLLDQQQLQSLLSDQAEQQDTDILWAELSVILVGVLAILQMAIYLGLSIKRLLKHQHNVEQQFSFLEQISLAWLKNLLLAFVILYFSYLADVFLAELLAFPEEVIGIHFLLIVLVIYTMGYMGLRQPAIFTQFHQADPNNIGQCEKAQQSSASGKQNGSDPAATQTKYQRSALDSETSQLLYQELQKHMDEQRAFLDSKLTMPQLAAQLSISANYLSQVINEQAECNFFDFINRYRIVEAQRRLTTETGQINILAIALDAGFNSKSAFYTAFKRHTGQTPSQYRKSAANQISSKQATDL
ncbi:MAG: helix-turn-helix domain-containing protein, partial [Candidatus Thiodiazotropha sp.]